MEIAKELTLAIKIKKGKTIEHIASRRDNIKLLRFFVEVLDITPFVDDKYNHNCIHIAIINASFDVVKYLIEKFKISVIQYTSKKKQNTLLHLCVKYGQLEILKYLISTAQMDFYARNLMGDTILHTAAETGNLQIVSYLIEKLCMSPHSYNTIGEIPLHIAVEKQQFDIIKYLIEIAKTNPYTTNALAKMPFDYCNLDKTNEVSTYMANYYRQEHQNIVIIKEGTVFALNYNTKLQIKKNTRVNIHNGIKFLYNGYIITSVYKQQKKLCEQHMRNC